jgi:hypothetical protein
VVIPGYEREYTLPDRPAASASTGTTPPTAGPAPDEVVVTAVDRAGNEGPPTIVRLPAPPTEPPTGS